MGAGKFCLRRSWAIEPICSSVNPAGADGVLPTAGTVTSPCLEDAVLVAPSQLFEETGKAVEGGAGTDGRTIGGTPMFVRTGGLASDIEFTEKGWSAIAINDGAASLRLELRLERYKKRIARATTKASPPIVPPTIAAMGFLCESPRGKPYVIVQIMIEPELRTDCWDSVWVQH